MKKNRMFISVLLICLIFSLTACQGQTPNLTADSTKTIDRDDKMPLTFYYDGVCASCETEEAFRTLMQTELKGLDLSRIEYRAINVMSYDGNWKDDIAKDFPAETELSLPLVRIGDQLLVGDGQIENHLRQAAHIAFDIDYTAYIYYHRLDCPDCQDIEAKYNSWKEQAGIVVVEKNVKDEAHLNELRAIFDKLDLEGDDRQIPFFITEDESEYWIIFRVNELLKLH